jgi:diguanylate cyclase (GGDEF)-like protein
MNRKVLPQSLLIVVVILVASLATYFIVYRPLNQQLKHQTYENYRIISSQKESLLEQFIERSKEGANSLSSRTFIRNAIQDYHDGIIDFTELADLTEPIYKDGFSALVNASSASRVVDGMIVAEINETLDRDVIDRLTDIDDTRFEIITRDDLFLYVDVISPIVNDGQVIGHDVVSFCISPVIETLSEGDGLATIRDFEQRSTLFAQADIITEQEEYGLLIKDGKVFYVSDEILNGCAKYLCVEIAQNLLEEEINVLTRRTLLWSGFLILISLGFVVWINLQNASIRLQIAEEKRVFFQEKANKDALTGVYSRHYLDDRLDRFRREPDIEVMPLAVVMVDLNGFKTFNDTYGHQKGNEALRDVAKIIASSIREIDLVVRYGGDEFLLFFENCDEKLCEDIMMRINKKMENVYEDKDVSLAYGYVIVSDPEKIESSIDVADRLMYEHKRKLDQRSV